jgi:DNA polymerase-3 subunit gamma/tau
MCQAVIEGRALDIIEIDAASNRGIDEIRELRERVNYAPSQARYKVYIVDEVHMLTKEASNALLKTLEEPPPHVIFILATTEAHKVLPTILSRCQRFDFRRLSQADVVSKLTRICSVEGIHIGPEALRLVAKSATGSLRDAENILEQLTTYYGSEVELHQVQAVLGITGDWRARELVKHIVGNDVSAGLATINSVNSDGLDLRQFNREVVEYLRGLLLMKTGADEAIDFTPEDRAELKDLATLASLPQILRAVKLFGEVELGLDNYSTLPLELALVDCILAEGAGGGQRQTEKITEKIVEAAPPRVSVAGREPPQAKARPASIPKLAPEAAPASAPLGSEVEQLRLNWKRVVEEAPADIKRTNAVALLRSAGVRPVKIEGDTVILAFKYSIHKENVEKPENQQVTEKIISHFLGRPCRVRCIYEPEDNHLVEAAKKMGAQITHVEEK